MRRTLLIFCAVVILFGCAKKRTVTVRGIMKRDGITFKSVEQTVQMIRELDQRKEIRLLDDTYSLVHKGVLPLGEKGFKGTFEYLDKDYFDTARVFKPQFNRFYSNSGTRKGGYSYSPLFLNADKMTLSYKNDVFDIPRRGPMSLSIAKSEVLIGEGSVWIGDNMKKVIHHWGNDGTYYDSFNINPSDQEFLFFCSSFSYDVNPQKELLHIIPVSSYMYYMELRKREMETPLVMAYDMKRNHSKIYRIEGVDSNRSLHGASLLDNGEEGLVYIPAVEPSLLFIGPDYKLKKQLSLKGLLKKHHLEHVYEGFEYVMHWGDIYHVSEEKLVILFPYYHSKEFKPTFKGERIDSFGGAIRYIGEEEKRNQRFAVEINLKTMEIERYGVFDLGIPYETYYVMSVFGRIDPLLTRDRDHILILYRTLTPKKSLLRKSLFEIKLPDEMHYLIYQRVQ